MLYYPQTINFREVFVGDTFQVPLLISSKYQLTPQTSIEMLVRPSGDIPEAPVVRFSTADQSITISGQEITLSKSALEMAVRPGMFVYNIRFTNGSQTHTLCRGLFEIVHQTNKFQ